MPRTRLAPSPTGALHLGNARTFLVTWALARQRGWDIVLRIEDLDGPRVKPEYVDQAIVDLKWLGLDWDSGPITQRHDLAPYRAALRELRDRGLVYKCTCTRQQVEAATLSAPHGDDHELRYPGTCRPDAGKGRSLEASHHDEPEHAGSVAFRLRAPEQPIIVSDQFLGPTEFDLATSIGDYLVWTKQGVPSYQLAVVVDDHRQGVDQIVRGADLLPSAARQMWIYECLGLGPVPAYTHLPLVIGDDGRRLAKRHGDTRIGYYRSLGVPAARVRGLLARWSGTECDSISAREFAATFRIETMPRTPIVFRAADDAWLRNATVA